METPQPPKAELDALLNTIRLAQEAGCEQVNLTFWGQGPYADIAKLKALNWPDRTRPEWPRALEQQGKLKWPDALLQHVLTQPRELMRRFARVIEAVRRERLTCVTHATVQNEPNGSSDLAHCESPLLSMRLYEWLYRLFDQALREIDDPLRDDPQHGSPDGKLRGAVKLVAGDLVLNDNSPQDDWLAYIRTNMDLPRPSFPCVVDGYSIHVYWDPAGGRMGFPKRLEDRFTRLCSTLRDLGIDKPMYVTEYGVRKTGSTPEPGGPGSGRTIEFSHDVALQHAWFNAVAPQHGCAGLVKWVLYRTDAPAAWGEWGMIEAPNAPAPRQPFERSSTYRVTRLFNHLVPRSWQAAGLGRGSGTTVVASRFTGGDDESLAVVNRGARALQVEVVGVKPFATFHGADWNRDRHGGFMPLPNVVSGERGSVVVTVPRHGAVGLSTRPLDL